MISSMHFLCCWANLSWMPPDLPRILVIVLSIRAFCYVLCISIFYFKLFFSYVVDFSLSILHRLVDRIFFRYFRISCFVCIAWLCAGIFWVSFVSPKSFDQFLSVVLSDLSALVFFVFSFHYTIVYFSFLCTFTNVNFLICPSCLISQLGFVFLLWSEKNTPHWLNELVWKDYIKCIYFIQQEI